MLFRVSQRMAANSDEAEDMVQQTLVKAFRKWDQFDGSHLRAWLIRILRNEVLMARRSASQEVSLERVGEGEMVQPPFWTEVLWRERQDLIMEALDSLPEHHRLLVQLCDVEGLTYGEAAHALDIPIGTVRSRLFRARAALRERLQPSLAYILGADE